VRTGSLQTPNTMAAPKFLPSLARPIVPEERYHVAPQLGPTRAEKAILAEICEGTFRPPDAAENARIEEAYALFVPFWRIDMQRSDTAIRLSGLRVGGVPIPHQASSEAKATWMVCARTAFPYVMKHPSTFLPGDAKPLTLSLAAMEHGDPDTKGGWEILDADVDEAQARRTTSTALAHHSSQANALLGESQEIVQAIHFVRYPIWFARYRYRGQAAPSGNDLFYLGLSAVDGTQITAEHPSKLRAGAARVKKLFGLDD
jgi:hypothetical protein